MSQPRPSRSELLDEYHLLWSALQSEHATAHLTPRHQGPPIAAVTDLSWLTGTSGKPMEVLRLLRTAEAACGMTPKAHDLLARVKGYYRQSGLSSPKRPRPTDWVRLVEYVRHEMKVVEQDIARRTENALFSARRKIRRITEMERRLIELEWLLRDVLPDHRELPWWHPSFGRYAV